MNFDVTQRDVPRAFARIVADISTARFRSEVSVEEMPAPTRIAPYAYALSADVTVDEEVGSGRLILLHDPAGNAAWEGDFRCVTFAKALIEPEMAADPLLNDVGWSWLNDALAAHGCDYHSAAGTVTAIASKSFGGLADQPASAEIEIRASWTPVLDLGAEDFAPHLHAWAELLCLAAGIPPVPDGVKLLAPRGRRTWRS